MNAPGAGAAGFPARLVAGRAAIAALRPGAILVLHSVRSAAGVPIELEGAGLRFAPTSNLNLPPGERVRVRVVSVHPHVRLNILGPADTSTGADVPARGAAGGLPNGGGASGPTVRSALQAIMTAQRAVTPELLHGVSARLHESGDGGRVRRRSRSLVEALGRGMDPPSGEQAGLEELLMWLAGTGDRDHRGKRGDDRSRRSPERSGGTGLAGHLTRATATPTEALQAFNYLDGGGDLHWIVVPVGASRDGRRTQGALRVGIDRRSGRPRSATLSVAVAAGTWWFSWTAGPAGLTLSRVQAIDGAPAFPESLLARMGGTRHTVVTQEWFGDGFSEASADVDNLGIDAYG